MGTSVGMIAALPGALIDTARELLLERLECVSVQVPLAARGDAEGNEENDDANRSDDVRRHRDRARDIAGVCPDESDDGADDQDGDHHRQPIENPASADDGKGTPLSRNLIRSSHLMGTSRSPGVEIWLYD